MKTETMQQQTLKFFIHHLSNLELGEGSEEVSDKLSSLHCRIEKGTTAYDVADKVFEIYTDYIVNNFELKNPRERG